MPVYVYERPDGSRFELRQSFHDSSLTEDPETGVPVHRVMQAPPVIFKGSGWYKTDSRAASKDANASSEPAKTDAKTDTADAAKGETPAAKTETATATTTTETKAEAKSSAEKPAPAKPATPAAS